MEIVPIAGMLFTLLFTGLIGGIVIVYPLSKRLGALMESKMRTEKEAAPRLEAEVKRLESTIQELESELHAMKERQSFAEALLVSRAQTALPQQTSKP